MAPQQHLTNVLQHFRKRPNDKIQPHPSTKSQPHLSPSRPTHKTSTAATAAMSQGEEEWKASNLARHKRHHTLVPRLRKQTVSSLDALLGLGMHSEGFGEADSC
jgi:hypothetical protein